MSIVPTPIPAALEGLIGPSDPALIDGVAAGAADRPLLRTELRAAGLSPALAEACAAGPQALATIRELQLQMRAALFDADAMPRGWALTHSGGGWERRVVTPSGRATVHLHLTQSDDGQLRWTATQTMDGVRGLRSLPLPPRDWARVAALWVDSYLAQAR